MCCDIVAMGFEEDLPDPEPTRGGGSGTTGSVEGSTRGIH
jgi:hypothetical protein